MTDQKYLQAVDDLGSHWQEPDGTWQHSEGYIPKGELIKADDPRVLLHPPEKFRPYTYPPKSW